RPSVVDHERGYEGLRDPRAGRARPAVVVLVRGPRGRDVRRRDGDRRRGGRLTYATTGGASGPQPTSRAAATAIGPSSANRCSGTRSFGPQMLSTASGRPVRSSTGADTPYNADSSSPAHVP